MGLWEWFKYWVSHPSTGPQGKSERGNAYRSSAIYFISVLWGLDIRYTKYPPWYVWRIMRNFLSLGKTPYLLYLFTLLWTSVCVINKSPGLEETTFCLLLICSACLTHLSLINSCRIDVANEQSTWDKSKIYAIDSESSYSLQLNIQRKLYLASDDRNTTDNIYSIAWNTIPYISCSYSRFSEDAHRITIIWSNGLSFFQTYGIVPQTPFCDFASLQYRNVNKSHHTLI